VVAGLAPLNSSNLQWAPPQLASLYITAYNMGFITDPKFVTSVPPISCSSGPDCTSLFLPGGLELVRLQGQNGSGTLFGSNLPGDYTTIVIENAPGFHLEFSSLGTGFVFDPAVCRLYGESINDGIYICLAKDGPTMVAGKFRIIQWHRCDLTYQFQDGAFAHPIYSQTILVLQIPLG
jgi:hypothetical protein